MTAEAPEATELVRFEWMQRVEAEYRSSAATQTLTLWLTRIGASPDLIRAGLNIAEDELVHAEMAHAVLLSAGGHMTRALDRDTLGLPRSSAQALEVDVLRHGVEIFCLGETIAVRLFSALRAHCRVPVVQEALDRVLVDEVRHRDFGWALLGWLWESQGPEEVVPILHAELPAMMARQRASYATSDLQSVSPAEQAWGLMAGPRYAEILEQTIDRDYIPRFAALGFDARELLTG